MPDPDSTKKEQEKKEHSAEVLPQTQFPPPYSGPVGPTYGATANPVSQQIINLIGGMQSFRVDKEPNPEIVRVNLEALIKVSDNIATETIKNLELQTQRDTNLYSLVKNRESRDHQIALIVLFSVIAFNILGIVFIFSGLKNEGIGLIIGGFSALLGFLGGFGTAKKNTNV